MNKLSSREFDNINVKIAVSFFVLLISIILVILIVNRNLFKETLAHSEKELSRSITNILKISINRISFSGKYHAQVFADNLISKEKSLMYIYIINDTGRVIAKSVSQNYTDKIPFSTENYQLLYSRIGDDSYIICNIPSKVIFI